jgi:hypothetical protein
MQWFKHPNDFRNDPRLRAIEKKIGEAGYARVLKLFEIVAERGGKADRFSPVLDLNSVCTDLDWLADELRISKEELQQTLETFAAVDLIDQKDWRKQIIRIPHMDGYLDEWTQRKQRAKTSRDASEPLPRVPRATPEKLPSDSGKSKSIEKEKEAEEEAKRKVAAATAAADALLKEKEKDHWESIEMLPCGLPEFQEIWESIWKKRDDAEWISDTMERCIQACKQCDVRVPKPFYDAKHKIESQEFDEEVGPYINGEKESPEMARMSSGGPTYRGPDAISRIPGPTVLPAEYQR